MNILHKNQVQRNINSRILYITTKNKVHIKRTTIYIKTESKVFITFQKINFLFPILIKIWENTMEKGSLKKEHFALEKVHLMNYIFHS